MGSETLLPPLQSLWLPPPPTLTVIADGASIGSHGAVTGEAIPLLQADALVGTGLFGAGGAGAWKGQEKETHPRLSQALHS